MQFSRENNLPFCNVTCQVRNWVRDIIPNHGQNRNLCDRSFFAFDHSCTFVNHCKVSVHVSWISASSWNFFTCRANFPQTFAVVGHISKNDKNVHIFFKCKIFCSGQCHSRRNKAFNSRIIRKIQKHHASIKSASFLKSFHEVLCFFIGDPHCSEDNNEIFFLSNNLCLTRDLQRNFTVRQSASRKDRKFLTANKRICCINRANACLDKIAWLFSAVWINRSSNNVKPFFWNNFRAAINRFSSTAENSPKHIFRNTDLDRLS